MGPAQRVSQRVVVEIAGYNSGNNRRGASVLRHLLSVSIGRELRWLARADPEYLVVTAAIRGGEIQGSIRTKYRSPQPTIGMVEFARNDLTHKVTGSSELKDSQRPVRQRRHCQSPVPRTPLVTIEEDAAAGSQSWFPRRPPGLNGVGELHEVGHGSVYVVVGDWIPAVVAARDQQVDLVVN